MKAVIAVIVMASILVVIMPVEVEGIRISSIDDAYIGEEVTISGVVVTVSSNVETCNVHTYEPGDTSILTIDDGSGTIQVCSDTRAFQTGERLMVSGMYAGGGIIYAAKLSTYVEHGYKDISVAELKGFSEYYYDHSVRVKGEVKRIELTPGKTKLRIEDDTGAIDVDYGVEIEDIRINEEVIVEGKFYRNMIYAVAVEPKYKKTVQSSPEHEQPKAILTAPPDPKPTPETPTPAPTLTPTPTPTATPTPTSASAANTGLSPPLYPLLIFASVIVMIIVTLISFKMKRFKVKWEMPKTICKKIAGKAICYWGNKQNQQVANDAGHMEIINSENVTIGDSTLTNNGEDAFPAYTSNSRIENVTVSKNYYGFDLHRSSNSILINDTANTINRNGIRRDYSSKNLVLTDNVSNRTFYI